jgi:Uma2 family endonuclease
MKGAAAMTVMTSTPSLPAVVPPFPVLRFTVDEYHQLIQMGMIGEDVELLEGWIVPKMGRTPTHDAVISWIMNRRLTPRLPVGWFCRGQSAITTADSEPEPDISVVRGSELDYLSRHPRSVDIALVIEVAESTLTRDRLHKARIYSAAAVPIYWIINLVDRQIEVYSDPSGPVSAPVYCTRRDYKADELVPFVVDNLDLEPIAARELLP